MTVLEILYIVLGVTLGLVLLILLFVYLFHFRYISFIKKNSESLKKLKEINSKYEYIPIKSFDMKQAYDADYNFDSVSCKDYFIYNLKFISKDLILSEIDKFETNKSIYLKYKEKVEDSITLGEYSKTPVLMFQKRLLKYEKKMFYKRLLPKPPFIYEIKVTLEYACSWFCKRKAAYFDINDINEIYDLLRQRKGDYYLNRDVWDAIVRVERAKVSNRMRFSIYKRDGYRCRICGSGSNLEIDHIKPIAKGGKTTYNNLQTLCHDCNVEKGTTYDPED